MRKSEKEIKQFLGLAVYYQKFIKDFAKVTKPLTLCLKKGNKIDYNNRDYIKAVETIKILISSKPIVSYPDNANVFTLTTDASNVALGAVLSHQDKPICFASRTLNEHELNHLTIERELLALVSATKYFRPFLFGRKFKANSDHKPIQRLHNLKEPNIKLQRWKIKLNKFDFDIKHIPGRENHIADALSRIKLNECRINEDVRSDIATVHSADEDNANYIPILERALNTFKNQLRLIRNNSKRTEKIKCFQIW